MYSDIEPVDETEAQVELAEIGDMIWRHFSGVECEPWESATDAVEYLIAADLELWDAFVAVMKELVALRAAARA